MSNERSVEHFVTLFDHAFLIHGLALHRSLSEHCPQFCLWIVCMDRLVQQQLMQINLPNVRLLALEEHETPELLRVKSSRTRWEYCFTMTPFVPEFVFRQAPHIDRVTYIDADLCFFNSPHLLFEDFEKSGKSVLMTEHGYAPEYEQSEVSGRFCVQFLTFVNNVQAKEILSWWQNKCLEWCYNRAEDGKCGDQKYLDEWPTLFSSSIFIVSRNELMMAPWNAKHLVERHGTYDPVFFHFHGFRFIRKNLALLFQGYRQFPQASRYYFRYLKMLKLSKETMRQNGISIIRTVQINYSTLALWLRNFIKGRIAFARI